jgi:Sulfatase-modifying factor enzyme 1
LPIRVILRRFAESLPPTDRPARAGDLWNFIAKDLKDAGHGLSAKTMEYVQRLARNHGALILLDGLDECGSPAARERVLAGVRELTRTAGNKCRFILTARPYAWPGGTDVAKGVYALADFDDQQVEQFIRGWYAALVARNWRTPGEAERKRDELLQTWQRADLEPLTRNPLLLTLTTTLHTNRGRLPEDRADLYNESVELLMLHWNRQIGADKALLDELAITGLKLSDLREELEELAFHLHQDSLGKESSGAADVGEDRLIRSFTPLLKSRDKAAVVVEYIEKRAGLLLGQGEKDGERQFTFPHRTFQEFLAACHLAVQDDFPFECARLARAAPGHWQVVLALAARVAKAERGASSADELIGGKSIAELPSGTRPAAADWSCALIAGLQLQEIGVSALKKRDRTSAIVTRVAGWLAAALPVHPGEDGLSARDRAQAGDILAALGDPRFDPGRFHMPADDDLGFAHIPADPDFRIGTRRADAPRITEIIGSEIPEEEINDAVTPTPEFYIARYPVTVAQFRAFVQSSGSAPGDNDALRDPDNRPVRRVSWHEALAYCDWLHETLKTTPLLADNEVARLVRQGGWRVTLPSELEWEKAARGPQPNAIFTWGDKPDPNCANYAETEVGDTSAVGCFPANCYGLTDILGNVWEWTRSLWDFDYPYDFNDRGARRSEGRRRSRQGGARRLVGQRSRSCALRFPFQASARLSPQLPRGSGGIAGCPCWLTLSSVSSAP